MSGNSTDSQVINEQLKNVAINDEPPKGIGNEQPLHKRLLTQIYRAPITPPGDQTDLGALLQKQSWTGSLECSVEELPAPPEALPTSTRILQNKGTETKVSSNLWKLHKCHPKTPGGPNRMADLGIWCRPRRLTGRQGAGR